MNSLNGSLIDWLGEGCLFRHPSSFKSIFTSTTSEYNADY
jgi:hypothetical protein